MGIRQVHNPQALVPAGENQFALADLEALGYAEADIVEDVGVAEIAKKPFVKQQKRAVAKMCT